MKGKIRKYISEHQLILQSCEVIADEVEQLVKSLRQAVTGTGRILLFGNGGSMADAQHFCAEIVGGFRLKNGHRAAITLGADAVTLSALANDYGYDKVFALQIEALGRPGDLALGLTTSGRSANIIEGLKTARRKGLATACLCGAFTDLVAPWSDVLVSVPSDETSHVQEAHYVILHACAMLVEQAFATEDE